MFTSRQIRAAELDLDDPQWYRRSSSAARDYVLASRAETTPVKAPFITTCLGCFVYLLIFFVLVVAVAAAL